MSRTCRFSVPHFGELCGILRIRSGWAAERRLSQRWSAAPPKVKGGGQGRPFWAGDW